MFSPQDLAQIDRHGLTVAAVERQLQHFRQGFPCLNLIRAASPADGITMLSPAEAEEAAARYEKAAERLDIVKFVPASGAATRMFKELFEFVNEGKRGKGIDTLLDNIHRFAFWPELDALLPAGADDRAIVDAIVNTGLAYGSKPKGLVTFHAYADGARKAVEEHLVEGAVYAASNGVSKIHFTVSPEHVAGFEQLLQERVPAYEKRFGIRYDISFSAQNPSTDTIAVDADNQPFRQEDDTLLFRPAGHGALIENLNEVDADVVFIKNIDNVTTDARRGETIRYKKVLAGILLDLQARAFDFLRALGADATGPNATEPNGAGATVTGPNAAKSDATEPNATAPNGAEVAAAGSDSTGPDAVGLERVADFVENELCVKLPENYDRMLLRAVLDRPIRVCGMVRNEGEPGGGPFWVATADGTQQLQIAEASQIAPEDGELMQSATHFNPVDLVCSLKNVRGERYDLRRYVDPATGFISTKSSGGRTLRAQELPGLWNGAMARWNTVFVDVPVETFSPVKVVQDLLRPQHQ